MAIDIIQAGLMVLNSAAAIACAVGYYREHGRRSAAQAATDELRCQLFDAQFENTSLRKTNRSLHEHADRMGQRNKFLAVELRGSDGTAKTCVWPQRKHTVFDRGGLGGVHDMQPIVGDHQVVAKLWSDDV